MKVYIASAILLLLQLASADELININEDLDQALLIANKFLTSKGMGLVQLREIVYDNFHLSNGVLLGANSLRRIGDATLRSSKNSRSFNVDLHVGQLIYQLVFGRVRLNGNEMSGSFYVETNSVHLNFSLSNYNETNCSFRFHQYEYESLTNATFKASIPQYDADVSEMFTNTVLPKMNQIIASQKNRLEKDAETKICQITPNLNLQKFLTDVLVIS